MQAVHVLNTVTVPMGAPEGSAADDRTAWGAVYDHPNRTVYWRSRANQNLQRLRLADAALAPGAATSHLSVQSPELPWYTDAAHAFAPL